MSLEGLSINFATVRQGANFGAIVDACLAHGITTISPWREQVNGIGLAEAARIVERNGLRLSGHCRGGFFPAPDAEGRLPCACRGRPARRFARSERCAADGGGRHGGTSSLCAGCQRAARH